jgi:hypothetical protein
MLHCFVSFGVLWYSLSSDETSPYPALFFHSETRSELQRNSLHLWFPLADELPLLGGMRPWRGSGVSDPCMFSRRSAIPSMGDWLCGWKGVDSVCLQRDSWESTTDTSGKRAYTGLSTRRVFLCGSRWARTQPWRRFTTNQNRAPPPLPCLQHSSSQDQNPSCMLRSYSWCSGLRTAAVPSPSWPPVSFCCQLAAVCYWHV